MKIVQPMPMRALSRARGSSMRTYLTAVLVMHYLLCPSNASQTAETYQKWRLKVKVT